MTDLLTTSITDPMNIFSEEEKIFSESLLSGDDNDRDKDLQKKIQIQRRDTDKVLPRPIVCYIIQKQGFKDLRYYIGCRLVMTKTKTKKLIYAF